jgi:hypothetical protein
MKDFFISYTLADRPWAEWISWRLQEANYTVVVQFSHFTPGSNFVLDMHRSLSEAGRTIAILSPDYVTSLFANSEWAAVFVQDPTGAKGKLVPVRVRKCDLTGLLASIVYIDLVSLEEKTAVRTLLEGIASTEHKPILPDNPNIPGMQKQLPHFPGSINDSDDVSLGLVRLEKYTQKIRDLKTFQDLGVGQQIIDEFYRRILESWYKET